MYGSCIAFSCDDVSPKTEIAKIKELLKVVDKFDMKVTFFVIPKSEAKWDSCGTLVGILKDAVSCGHEIGLHGLSHFLFETGYPFSTLGCGYLSIKNKILKGLKILNESLETTPRGFRAPYHHCSQSLWKTLEDLDFLYDSSQMSLTGLFLSYVPPLRAVCSFRKRGPVASRIFHPLNLRLWEIPVTQEYTWYNMKFEIKAFERFFKNKISRMMNGCLVVNSHIEALSKWSLHLLRELFLHVRETGLNELTLQEVAERYTCLESAKTYSA